MTTAKKIISIILAAALVFGSVAVTAFAETVVSEYAGSELTYWFDSDKTDDEGVTKLVPGDTITVTLSARTNYYWGNVGSELVLWNNELSYTKGEIEFSDVCSTSFSPKEAAVTTASIFPTNTSSDTHTMYKLSRQAQTDNLEAVAPNQDVLLYTWTFTLSEDAEVGSTVSVILPAEKVTTAENTSVSKYPIYQAVNNSDTLSSTNIVSRYAETVTVDTLDIQVVETYATEEPDVEDTVVYEYAGSKLTYWFDSNRTENGVTKLVPGDTITVTLSARTNYYWGNVGSELVLWNNELSYTKGEIEFSDVCSTSFSPKEAAVTTASIFPTNTSSDTHTMYKLSRQAQTDNLEAVAPNTDVLLYTWTFTLAADAEVGSTVSVILPAEKVTTAENTSVSKYPIYQAVNNSDTLSSTNIVSRYAETVIVDTLDIQVVSSYTEEPTTEEPTTEEPTTEEPTTEEPTTEEPTTEAPVEYADLTALQEAIAKAADADTANCTAATVAEFNEALAAANALNVEGTLATEQDAVNAAAQRLEDAITGLQKLGTVDYDALNAAIDAYDAKAADAGNYSNWAEYEALYTAAKAIDQTVVYDDEAGSVQTAVDAAAEALNDFVLVEYAKVNYDALNDAIAAYEAKVTDAGNYSNWDGYADLYADAVALKLEGAVYDKNGEQAAVDAAAAALNNYVLVEYAKVNYDALNDAIAAYEAKVADKDIYSNWAAYEALYNTAKEIDQTVVYDKNGEQAAADAAAEALANFELVEYNKVDYTALNEAIAAYEAKEADKNLYANWAEYEALYNEAKAIDQSVVYDKNGEQAEVDAAAEALANFVLEDKTLDYTAWNNAVAAIPADLAAYKPASVTAYEAAKADAETAKAEAVDALDQTALDAAAADLVAAIALLEEKADNSALAAAIARAEALVEANYTPDSWTAADLANVLAAANVVLANGDATAEEIAAQVAAIEAAEAKLVIKADKAALLEALQAAQALVENEAAYTPASFAEANLAAVMADAQVVYEDDNATAQAVADAITALKAAEAKLVLKADKTALEAAINTEVVLENATSATLAAYNEALEAAQAVLADDNATEEEVLTATNNLLAAIDGMKYLGTCDYTALDAVITEAEALNADDYTTTSWYSQAYLNTYLEAAKEVARDMIADEAGENQAIIDDAATALRTAIDTLELRANLADLKAAIAAEPKVAEEYATEDTWAAYAEKLAAAQALADEEGTIGVSRQAEVDAAAEALVAANDALVEADADYTAVEEALAYVETKGELNQYTQATVKALEKAIDAVVYDLGISRQADIDAWAEAIVKAADALEISEAAVTKVDVDLSEYYERAIIDYAFTVTGAPTKLQIIYPNGSTMTYDRYNRYIEIVSYNENGEVVDYTEEAPAYEVWTIALSLGEGTHQAKAKLGSTWEAFSYEFDVEFAVAPDPREEEVTFVAKQSGTDAEAGKTVTAEAGSIIEVTVIVPSSVVKVQVSYPAYGNTSTFTAANASVVDNGDGTSTWTIVRNAPPAGKTQMTLLLKDSSGWYEPNAEDVNILINYEEAADSRDAEVTFVAKQSGAEAEASKQLVLDEAGAAAEITIVVPDTVAKVQVYFADGRTSTYDKSSAAATVVENEDGTVTWTIVRNFKYVGNYEMNLKLKDKSGWYDAVTEAIDVTVNG